MDDDRIIQVIPCTKPMIAVFEDENGVKYYFHWVYYIGLTEGGEIEPLVNMEGWFERCNYYNNYVGSWCDLDSASEEAFYEEMKAWKESQSEH